MNPVRKLTLLFYALFISSTIFSQPVITSFSPTSGTAGTTVIINGTNFDPVAANNIVYFGPVRAAVTAATSTTLTVIVPVFAGNAPITVTTNHLTAYSINSFAPAFTGGSFNTKLDFRLGFGPDDVKSGDIDGDGKPDLIFAHDGSFFMSILRNTSSVGAVSFDPRIDFQIGGFGNSIALADFDGDGKLDIICVNASNKTSSLFLNASTPGNISLVRQDFTTNSISNQVTAGDIDGDGKPDVAITAAFSGVVAVFLNSSPSSGVITFANEVDLFTPGNSQCILFKDLDGDNKPDLSIVSPGANSFSVLRNLSIPGSVIFSPSQDFITNDHTYVGSIADFDGDGKLDMLVNTNVGSFAVTIYRNTGTPGTISFSPGIVFPMPGFQNGVASDDLDGDGKPDIELLLSDFPSSVFCSKNQSTIGNFSFLTGVSFPTGLNPWRSITNDIDGDGKPEIVTANRADSSASILINQSTALPLTLTSFLVSLRNQQAQLNWQTTNEINTSLFAIERSTDGHNFISIGTVNSINNPTNSNYEFSDKNVQDGLNFYRLKMVDKDARFEYSKIVKLVNSSSNDELLRVYPNPTSGFVTIEHPFVSSSTQLILVDMQEKIVRQIDMKKGTTTTTIDLTGLATGAYKLAWKDKSKTSTSTLIVR